MAYQFHPTKAQNYAWYLQDASDEVLADAYEQYMDNRGSAWFHDIFWEANRRGLSLDDLEQILLRNYQ